ncbi:MAG: barstar family protein [Lachnospiraceae bacterium]|nr:barstar family protein [Lachnospiraceae bacterium]
MKQEPFTEYKLDFTGITTREELHDYLAEKLELPDYYGRNLDALYDCLTEMPLCMISLYHMEALECLGDYALSFAETMEEAAAENLRLIMIYVTDEP